MLDSHPLIRGMDVYGSLVDAATSANDFDLRNVRKRPLSIYLGVTPDNLERMAPLLNLFFQQLIDVNTRELPNQNPAYSQTCLLLMDEFTAMAMERMRRLNLPEMLKRFRKESDSGHGEVTGAPQVTVISRSGSRSSAM